MLLLETLPSPSSLVCSILQLINAGLSDPGCQRIFNHTFSIHHFFFVLLRTGEPQQQIVCFYLTDFGIPTEHLTERYVWDTLQ